MDPNTIPAPTPAPTTSSTDPTPAEGTTQPATTEPKKDGGDLLTGNEPKATPTTATKPGPDATAPGIEIKVPEGVEIDKALMDEYTGLFTEGKADPQKVFDLFVKAQGAFTEKAESAWKQTTEQWREEASKDKEIGGANFTANVAVARRAIDKFGGEALKQTLNDLGLGNHPEIVRFAYRVGKAISDDTVVSTPGAAPSSNDREAMLREAYPTMYPKQ